MRENRWLHSWQWVLLANTGPAAAGFSLAATIAVKTSAMDCERCRPPYGCEPEGVQAPEWAAKEGGSEGARVRDCDLDLRLAGPTGGRAGKGGGGRASCCGGWVDPRDPSDDPDPDSAAFNSHRPNVKDLKEYLSLFTSTVSRPTPVPAHALTPLLVVTALPSDSASISVVISAVAADTLGGFSVIVSTRSAFLEETSDQKKSSSEKIMLSSLTDADRPLTLIHSCFPA